MAAAGAIGGLLGGAISAGVTTKLARENRKWQEKMANTAYQRTMRDMRKAGLNPILAGKLGGAATPPGGYTPVTIDGTAAVTTALAVRRQRQELKNMEAGERLLDQQSLTEGVKRMQAGYTMANTMGSTAQTLLQNKAIRAGLVGKQTEAEIDATSYGKTLRYMGRLNPFGGTAKAIFTKGK